MGWGLQSTPKCQAPDLAFGQEVRRDRCSEGSRPRNLIRTARLEGGIIKILTWGFLKIRGTIWTQNNGIPRTRTPNFRNSHRIMRCYKPTILQREPRQFSKSSRTVRRVDHYQYHLELHSEVYGTLALGYIRHLEPENWRFLVDCSTAGRSSPLGAVGSRSGQRTCHGFYRQLQGPRTGRECLHLLLMVYKSCMTCYPKSRYHGSLIFT